MIPGRFWKHKKESIRGWYSEYATKQTAIQHWKTAQVTKWYVRPSSPELPCNCQGIFDSCILSNENRNNRNNYRTIRTFIGSRHGMAVNKLLKSSHARFSTWDRVCMPIYKLSVGLFRRKTGVSGPSDWGRSPPLHPFIW